MPDIIDQSFVDLFERASGTPAVSEKVREFVLSRIRPLMGRSFDEVAASNDKSPDSVKRCICALVARELVSGRISETEFWRFMKYEDLFSKDTRFKADSDRGPQVVLRYGTARTPPVILWRDGTWGWRALFGGANMMFGMEIFNAGRTMQDPSPYIMRIDAMNRANESSGTQPTKNSGCFIATVCYGDYDAPEVLTLRCFRDKHLLTSRMGTAFVRLYYTISPSIAARLSQHRHFARAVRCVILNPLVRMIGKLRWVTDTGSDS